MTNKTNPDSSADAAPQLAADMPEAAEVHGGLPGRVGIWVIGGVLMLFALMAMRDFGNQFFDNTPYGEMLFDQNSMWVYGYLVRGVGWSILSWQLFQYAIAIGKVKTADDLPGLSQRHGAMWNWGAIVLVVFVGYGMATFMLM